jgi:hypothetical protein
LFVVVCLWHPFPLFLFPQPLSLPTHSHSRLPPPLLVPFSRPAEPEWKGKGGREGGGVGDGELGGPAAAEQRETQTDGGGEFGIPSHILSLF